MRKGYAHLVGDEHDLGVQCAALTEAGCAELIIERENGPAALERLARYLGRLHAGDQLVVHRFEALASDTTGLSSAMGLAVAAGATVKVLWPTPLRLCPFHGEEAEETPAGPDGFDDRAALTVARALDHPFRLMIFRAIHATGDAGLSRRRISVPAPMAGAALTTHLRALDEAGLIEPRRSADETCYVARSEPLAKFLNWLATGRDVAAREE